MQDKPSDWVVMGRVGAPYGVQGWLRVTEFTAELDGLTHYPRWWLGRGGQYHPRKLLEWRLHGGSLIVLLEDVPDRTVAEGLRGTEIAIPRDSLPRAEEGEFYWNDLLGFDVINRAGEPLGVIEGYLETGSNDVMVVRQADRERLIPYVDPIVERVDVATRQIVVDWGLDY